MAVERSLGNKTAMRDERGRLLPGHSANPSGVPKGLAELAALCRTHTPAAVAALVKNLDDDNGAVRTGAAKELLDRAWGKSKENVTVDAGEGLVTVIKRIIEDR